MNLLFTVVAAWSPLALVLSAVMVPGDAASLPKGPAPRFFTVTAAGLESCELREVGRTENGLTMHGTYKPQYRHLDITEASGKKITAQEFAQRVKVGTMVAVAADEHAVDAAYRAVLKPDTFVLQGVIVRVEAEPAVRVRVK